MSDVTKVEVDDAGIINSSQGVPPEETPLPSEAGQKQATQEEERLLAGKYKSVEDLEKGYAELVKKLGSQSKPQEETADTPTQKEGNDPQSQKVEGANLDRYAEEYMESGELSADSYAELEKMGFPREMVDAYVAGQEAIQERFVNQVTSIVGGGDRYDALMRWAENNLSNDEIQAYNNTLASEDFNQIKMALENVQMKYIEKHGVMPNHLTMGDTSSSTDAGGYQSVAQIQADMSDPRYQTDSAYRRKVENKMANTPASVFNSQ